MNKNTFRNWSEATTSFINALLSAQETVAYGYLVEIRYLPNEEHAHPMKQINPALSDPFAWESGCSYPLSPEERKKRIEDAKSETEKDLIENWTTCFSGTQEAIDLYKAERKITPELMNGMGRCTNVRVEDIVKYLREIGENERADIFEQKNWVHLWTPTKENPYWSPVPNIKTYAVYVKKPQHKMTFGELELQVKQSIIDLGKQLEKDLAS